MKKLIISMILIISIMIIPANASILTLPDLPGEYEDYIIYYSFSSGSSDVIYAITFNGLGNIYVGTYEEYLDLIDPNDSSYTNHEHEILYFRRKVDNGLEYNQFKLVGDDWECLSSNSGRNTLRVGASGTYSIQKSDILYSSKDVIDLTDGSVFFFKGSWMKEALVRPTLGIIQFLSGFLIVSVAFWKGLQYLYKILRTG